VCGSSVVRVCACVTLIYKLFVMSFIGRQPTISMTECWFPSVVDNVAATASKRLHHDWRITFQAQNSTY